jgi:hypothetical protein
MFNKATIRIPISSLKHFDIVTYVIKDDELIIELAKNKNVAEDKKHALQSGILEEQSNRSRY